MDSPGPQAMRLVDSGESWEAQASRPVAYSDTPGDRSVNRHSMYRLKFREWEIHV